MKTSTLISGIILSAMTLCPAHAAKFVDLKIVDQQYLMVQFRDGEVHYRDDGTGPSAYLGHSFAEGDDTLVVFGKRIDPSVAASPEGWRISSDDDKTFGSLHPATVSRKAKPMNTDHTLTSELDHWFFLKLPRPMVQGCTYKVSFPKNIEADASSATVTYDIWNAQSEAIHVNILGYTPQEQTKTADLYLWLGDGGQRDYRSFVNNDVFLYNVTTGQKQPVGKVEYWKPQSASKYEAGEKDLTGSDVWKIDFACPTPGRYRLVVDGVGCSMDFDVAEDVYYQPYRYCLRGYYYMRIGEPADPAHLLPVPRQPRFIPNVDPKGFIVYKTDLTPWSEEWRKIHSDVWDEPHFKKAETSLFYQHRLPGNPVNNKVVGGHSDAFDWDRHLAHVSNIYDILLPYILTHGRLSEDSLTIRESGNGIPDLLDEARNEVDFFLSIRDGEAYSQGITNPDEDLRMMFQAGCTTMAAWANAANCAMMAEAFRIHGDKALQEYYTREALKAFHFAGKQKDLQLDELQNIGVKPMRGRDFRQMAAAFLYNLTGDTTWEKIMVEESMIKDDHSKLFRDGKKSFYQIWAAAAYITCPQPRHYTKFYNNLLSSINYHADENNVLRAYERPSRRAANDSRWQTSENLQIVMMAHYIANNDQRRKQLEHIMYTEAGWGLGRNPGNIVEMTGLGERHLTAIYTTGRNDGSPGVHPGQTPFNGTETWSEGNGGDARILLDRCYPSWYDGGWPRQESFFNQRYFWVNGEFTPRETMRGKMALLAYLYGIRP
ncbi:MAG: glycoside hydrolase family 9 protein [Prevotella sp.]|jgi:endoglucanase